MYYYIYDIFTADKKYEKQLLKIEGRLIELGIAGKIFKLNILKNLKEIIAEAEASEIKNIIVVGNDQTVSKLVGLMAGTDMVLGIIPVGEPNILAGALGIKSAEAGCKTIAARKVISLDIGKVNDDYFLFSLESDDKNILFDFKNYNINPLPNNKAVGIYNINITQNKFKTNPCDGLMEVVFTPQKSPWWKGWWSKNNNASDGISVFPVAKLIIKHKKKPIQVKIDRQRFLKTPLEVEVLPRKITMVVGRERIFN